MLSTLFASGTLLKIALGLVTLANSFLERARVTETKRSGAIENAIGITQSLMKAIRHAQDIEIAIRSGSDPAYVDELWAKYGDPASPRADNGPDKR